MSVTGELAGQTPEGQMVSGCLSTGPPFQGMTCPFCNAFCNAACGAGNGVRPAEHRSDGVGLRLMVMSALSLPSDGEGRPTRCVP